MGDRIDVDYEILNSITRRFSAEADAIQQLTTATRNKVQGLHASGWIGRGAEAFFAEMQNRVLPGMGRLGQALHEAAGATQKIIAAFQQGEEEAAGNFRQGSDAAAGMAGGHVATAGALGGAAAAGQPEANKLGSIGDKFMTSETINRVRDSSFMGNTGGPASDAKIASFGQGGGMLDQKGPGSVEEKQFTAKMFSGLGGVGDKFQTIAAVGGAHDQKGIIQDAFEQKGASGAGGGLGGIGDAKMSGGVGAGSANKFVATINFTPAGPGEAPDQKGIIQDTFEQKGTGVAGDAKMGGGLGSNKFANIQSLHPTDLGDKINKLDGL